MIILKEKITKFKAVLICAQCSQEYEARFYDAKKNRVGHLCKLCKRALVDLKPPFKQEVIQYFFDYDPDTGALTHARETLRGVRGTDATHAHIEGYRSVMVGSKSFLAHRIIWFRQTAFWPIQIDHIDHNRANNRWTNLRDVVPRHNQLNISLSKNSSSGVNGVRLLPSGRFNVRIMVQRKVINLGTYDTMAEATQIRKEADLKYGFHVNHGE